MCETPSQYTNLQIQVMAHAKGMCPHLDTLLASRSMSTTVQSHDLQKQMFASDCDLQLSF